MRVICLVPSLTETLIECGVNVVGRTRFCIHPQDKVASIPKVGGTKEVDWDKCRSLKPDIVVFDKEENRQRMAEQCPFPWVATHITSVDNIADELLKLTTVLECESLKQHATDWQAIASMSGLSGIDWSDIPGQLESLNNTRTDYQLVEYIIWREPWMAVGQGTFIGSVLAKLGFAKRLSEHKQAYPQLEESAMSDPNTFYLFSSEPYPFLRHKNALFEQGFNGAIVDGEVYSWFGIRSYRALAAILQCNN